MKVAIHYFSATGNTARAVQAVAARLAAAGSDVVLQSIDGRAAPALEIPDLTVVAFPILSWAAPHFVLDYARRLPKAQGARAAVLASGGGFGAQGVGEMERILRRRGYQVVASAEAVYPDNWTLAVNPLQGDDLAAALAQGDEGSIQFANTILSWRPVRFHCVWGHILWSWPIARLFRAFGRRFMGKFFAADNRCTACGQCAEQCPVRAIRLEGAPARPRWNASCAGCFRCINLCPVQAIQVSGLRLALHLGLNLALTVWWFFWIGWIRRLLPPLPGAASLAIAVLVAVALFAVATMLQLTAGDGLIQWLAARPALRGAFLRSHTKAFGRYRAPGFRPGP